MTAGDWERKADALWYWHAIEMFDPQGIPALLSRRELAEREPGSWCVEAVPFSEWADVPGFGVFDDPARFPRVPFD